MACNISHKAASWSFIVFTSPGRSFTTQIQVCPLRLPQEKGRGGRCFYFCQTAAYLPQSQPLRQRIYKFSCNGLINYEQHAAPWGRTFSKRSQQKPCSWALLMRCCGTHHWTLNEWRLRLGAEWQEARWPLRGRGGFSLWAEATEACHLDAGSLISSFSGDFHSLPSLVLLVSILTQVRAQLFLSSIQESCIRGCNFKTLIHSFINSTKSWVSIYHVAGTSPAIWDVSINETNILPSRNLQVSWERQAINIIHKL